MTADLHNCDNQGGIDRPYSGTLLQVHKPLGAENLSPAPRLFRFNQNHGLPAVAAFCRRSAAKQRCDPPAMPGFETSRYWTKARSVIALPIQVCDERCESERAEQRRGEYDVRYKRWGGVELERKNCGNDGRGH
jgi:hypothetical protein